MSLLVKAKKIKLEDAEMYCKLDMKSIETYKNISGESFMKGIQRISEMDEGVILNLIASTVRHTIDGDPVGKEFLEQFNPIALIMEMIDPLMELVEDAMPKSKPGDVKKKIVKK